MVHYMPWYASKPVSGEWGWHWTMNHFDPDTVADDGRREIASHYYPLIGPYDSNDPHALECHVLLMKFAGIDGAIIDWYGIKDHYDYATIHRNTNHLIYGYLDDQEGAVFGETLERAGESASLIQIVTWNDYGEGTIIEPTIEFGYRYLEALQNYRKKQAGKTFPYSPEDLRLPIALYQLRQQAATDGRAAVHLDSAAALLFASENEAARKILLRDTID